MIKLYDELMKNRELTKNAQFVFCLLDDFYKSSKNKNKHGEKVCRIKSKEQILEILSLANTKTSDDDLISAIAK